MTTRERMLAGGVATVLVLAGGVQAVRKSYIEPRRSTVDQIRKQELRSDTLDNILSSAALKHEEWQRKTQRTLDGDRAAAHARFRTDVHELLKSSGLADLNVRQGNPKVVNSGYRRDFVELPLIVHGNGTLEQVVGFLRELYQRPYLVRVTGLKLNVQGGLGGSLTRKKDRDRDRPGRPVVARKEAGDRREADENGPRLTVSIVVETLVLPQLPDIEYKPIDPATIEDPHTLALLDVKPWLRLDDVMEYDRVASTNFFRIWEPPPPPPPPEETKVATVETKPPPPPAPPPPDPRKDAKHFHLVGAAVVDDGPIVYVEDDREKTQPPAEHRLNQRVDDGTLVLIDPSGIVVRAVDSRTGAVKNYFYEMGEAFDRRAEVSPQTHPEIYRQLQQILASISTPDAAGMPD